MDVDIPHAGGNGGRSGHFREKELAGTARRCSRRVEPGAAAVCQICHQQNFVGGPAAPRLAGQRYEYLVEAMRLFADGERTNSADMTNIMKAMAPAEREAMARYISGL